MSSGGAKTAGGLLLATTSATTGSVAAVGIGNSPRNPQNSYSHPRQVSTGEFPISAGSTVVGSGGTAGSFPPPPPSVIRSSNMDGQANNNKVIMAQRRSVSHSGQVGGGGGDMAAMMEMLFPVENENGDVGGVSSVSSVGPPRHMKSTLNPLASLHSPGNLMMIEYDGSGAGGEQLNGHHQQDSPVPQQQQHQQIKQQQRLLSQFPQAGGTWSQASSGPGSYKASSLLDSHDR